MDLFVASATQEGGDRKPATVPPPSAYQGIGSALRNSYSAPAMSEEFRRLLAKLR